MTARVPWQGSDRPPRPWQAEALPLILAGLVRRERGLTSAVMGSGKSVLQAELAWLSMANLDGRAIVVGAPREALVEQLCATFAARCGLDAVGAYYGRAKAPDRPVVIACYDSLPQLQAAIAEQHRRTALVILDEAHRTETERVRGAVEGLAPWGLVGFTATPYRSLPSERLSLYSVIWYRYTLQQAVADGVLVPFRVVGLEELDPTRLDEACLELMQRHAVGPGIVSAVSIEDAETYARWLTEREWPALAIHSRLSADVRAARLEALRLGEVRCLVHVSLLAEGVDLPWLRWLCLRRRVGASVRFLQEVGRVGRIDYGDPTKTEGLVLDPRLLLGRFGWDTTEAIGLALDEAADAECQERAVATLEPSDAEGVALDSLLAHLHQVREMAVAARVIPTPKVDPGGWQLAPISEGQLALLAKSRRLTCHIPAEVRDPIKALVHVPHVLTRGQASELLDLLLGGQRWARRVAKERDVEAYMLRWSARVVRGADPVDPEAVKVVAKMGRRHEKLMGGSAT